MSDEGHIEGRLLERWRAGDTAAAAELVRRHHGPVFGFLLSMCGERTLAEDLMQETFLRVLERLADGYDERGRFRALLFQIARNLCADQFRGRARRPVADAAVLEAVASAEDLERAALERERSAGLAAAIAALPEAQREVVLLHYYSGLSFREIAELQDCPLNTCLGRMHYALKHLRKSVPEKEWAHGL